MGGWGIWSLLRGQDILSWKATTPRKVLELWWTIASTGSLRANCGKKANVILEHVKENYQGEIQKASSTSGRASREMLISNSTARWEKVLQSQCSSWLWVHIPVGGMEDAAAHFRASSLKKATPSPGCIVGLPLGLVQHTYLHHSGTLGVPTDLPMWPMQTEKGFPPKIIFLIHATTS